MASSSKKVEPTPAQQKLLDMELPDDSEIKEALAERDKRRAQDETDSDSDISSDSDFEDSMEQYIWDGLFPHGKPFTNSVEDLKKILGSLPLRFSTRHKKLNSDLNDEDEKSYQKMKHILESRLVVEEIDQEILMENVQRVRKIIKKKIKKKEKVHIDKMVLPECVVKLEKMTL